MKVSYKARKRWALFLLIIGLPVYIVVAITIVNLLGRPPIWAELLIYVSLGMVWIAPLKRLFLGLGQPDPDGE
jgi:predicted membrane channel-forming protein YqfA (hemolysin III family)